MKIGQNKYQITFEIVSYYSAVSLCLICIICSAVRGQADKSFSSPLDDIDNNEIRSEIHLEACSGEQIGHTLTKSIAACPGAWHGHIEAAGHLCSRNYKVCSWQNKNLLHEIEWSLASSITGCYALNAAQDDNQCSQCKNDIASDDLAAVGKHCPHVNFGQKGCLNEGRIDASCCVDSLTRRACSYVPGVITGVLCCYDPDSEKNKLYSDGGKAQIQLNHVVGERITLNCPIAPGSQTDEIKIAWFHGDQEIISASRQTSWTIPFLQLSDSGIYSCRMASNGQADPKKFEQLIQVNITVNEVKSKACQDGNSEGFHEAHNVRGCAGSWKGHIRRADKQLCGAGWRVCLPRDRHILKQTNRTYLTNFGGCFAYNAAHIRSKCKRCQNRYSMAALGRDCPINEPFVLINPNVKLDQQQKRLNRHQSRQRHQQQSQNQHLPRDQRHACFDNRVIQIYSNKFLKQSQIGGCLYGKNDRITGVLCCKKGIPNNGQHFQMDPPVDDELPQKEEILNCYPGCRSGGTCVQGTCVCPHGYFGHACQHGGCNPECQNGGVCLYGYCKCNPPYFGLTCQNANSGAENSTEDIFDNQLTDTIR